MDVVSGAGPAEVVGVEEGALQEQDPGVADVVEVQKVAGGGVALLYATKALEAYDHARALEVAESFFWTFCDDYLELVKERAYNQTDVGQASAALALRMALATLLRLFAPVLVFAAEESWSWFNDGSVHTAEWPQPVGIEGDAAVLRIVGEALIGIRRAKTEAKVSQKAPVSHVTIAAPADAVAALRLAEGDLRAVGRIAEIRYTEAEALQVTEIELAPQED